MWLSLRQGDKFSIPRGEFLETAKPEAGLSLSDENKRVLKQWLAARYGRPAFPDGFESRLRVKVSGRQLEKRLRDIVEPVSDSLVALLFDLGEDRQSELSNGQAYGLSITLVYDSIDGGPRARRLAEACEQPIRRLFEQAFGPADEATEIVLESCVALADAEVSLADLRRVDVWRFEHLSLDDESPAPVLPRGEFPA